MIHKILGVAVLGGAVVFGAQGALAEDGSKDQGFYLGASGGWAFIQDVDNSLGTNAEYEDTWVAHGAVGYDFNPFRVEGEVSWLEADADKLKNGTVSGGEAQSASGDTSTLALMVNGYFDLDTGSKWKPYIGLGMGAARIDSNNVTASGFTTADDDDYVFAAQGMLGIGYEVVDDLVLSLGYRAFWSDDASMTDSTGANFDVDGTQYHSVELGLRYTF